MSKPLYTPVPTHGVNMRRKRQHPGWVSLQQLKREIDRQSDWFWSKRPHLAQPADFGTPLNFRNHTHA